MNELVNDIISELKRKQYRNVCFEYPSGRDIPAGVLRFGGNPSKSIIEDKKIFPLATITKVNMNGELVYIVGYEQSMEYMWELIEKLDKTKLNLEELTNLLEDSIRKDLKEDLKGDIKDIEKYLPNLEMKTKTRWEALINTLTIVEGLKEKYNIETTDYKLWLEKFKNYLDDLMKGAQNE
jgi:hypothetical protein